MAIHETDSEDDYRTGFFTCTATAAVDKAQARHHREVDERNRVAKDEGWTPGRARQWIAWTDAEGPPTP